MANPATTEPISVIINNPVSTPWKITAPTNVIKGYKEDFVFTCNCNNLYSITSFVKTFTIEQEKLDCTTFLEQLSATTPIVFFNDYTY